MDRYRFINVTRVFGYWRGLRPNQLKNFMLTPPEIGTTGSKSQFLGFFDPKNYHFQFYTPYLFSAVVGPMFDLKIMLYYFQHFFFQKKSKITFFHYFDPKFVIFQKDNSGSFFRKISLKRYKFEEFLHI